jgi:hypothetical protein
MKENHIIELLEHTRYSSLSERELNTLREHAARCPDCQRAYEAARVTELLLKERAAVTLEPSPFFHTRVMAALRERQPQALFSPLQRWWRAANALVSAMVALVALLAALTYFGGEAQTLQPELGEMKMASAFNLELFEQASFTPDDELTYWQVITTLYEPETDAPESNLENRNGQR